MSFKEDLVALAALLALIAGTIVLALALRGGGSDYWRSEFRNNGVVIVEKADGKWLYFTDNDGVEHQRKWVEKKEG